jgi:phosphatidylglycerol:prolipoprotein diacylglycerol transferase
MYPVLFQFGSFVVYTYGVALTLGVIVATFLIWRRARKLNFDQESVIDMILFSMFLSLVFARTAYVVGNFDQFSDGYLKILLVTSFPGLDGAAALLGGLIGFLAFGLSKHWSLRPLFDCIVKGLSLGIAIVMMGAFFAASYIGTPTDLPWGVIIPGHDSLRHPIALYYALTGFVIFTVLVLIDRKHHRDGLLTSLFLLFIGVAMIVFEWMTESGLVIASIHYTQIVGLLCLISGIVLLYRMRRTNTFTIENS